jgi:hypothetical protein
MKVGSCRPIFIERGMKNSLANSPRIPKKPSRSNKIRWLEFDQSAARVPGPARSVPFSGPLPRLTPEMQAEKHRDQ